MVKRLAPASICCFLLLSATLVITSVMAAGPEWSIVPNTSASSSTTEPEEKAPAQKKDGKGFMSALTAPFRAIGRLFDGGKKKDKTAKFESTPVMRVTSGDSPAQAGIPKSDWDPFQVHLSRGRELLSAGDPNNAISELSLATSINSKSAEAYKLLGLAYAGKRLNDRALQAFEAAVKLDENNADHLNNFGYMLFKTGDYERATKYLKRAAKIAPTNSRVWNNLALAQCQRGKFDDGYESFVKAVGEFGGHVNMAIQLQRFGYAKDAIKHLERARAMQPNSTEVLTRLVALYESAGRPDDAETARRSLVGLKTFADAKP